MVAVRPRAFSLAAPFAAALIAVQLAGAAEEPIPHRQDRPPNRPYSPEEARERMTVPEGFTVELVASEPRIANPLSMAFDDRGRIFITESIEYPRREPGPGRDRVQVLEDTDQDGAADRFTVFAGGLNIPSGIAVGHGGVWVLNAPDLLFLEEADGKESRREVVVTGFGRADTHELPSTLTWGPDGWLYGLNGVFNPSRIVSGGREHRFTCALFRVHPRTRVFEVICEGTSNPWGLAWDPEGSAIVSACHWAKDHLFHFVETGYYQRQAGAYPPHTWRIGSITGHGHQKTAYCGLAYLDSESYPEEYRGRFYFGNVHGGAINSDRLRRDGSTYRAEAEPDLLAANDAWFVPVSQKVGPDGCLYVLDWYDRYHCYQDAGRDPQGVDRSRGRLWRIRHRSSPRAEPFDLARESEESLLERLKSPNIFFREAAQRVLAERRGGSSRRRLEDLALDQAAPRRARLHALWALIGSGPLEPGFHARVLEQEDPALRAWGVRAAREAGRVETAVRARVAALARDRAPQVQLEAAIASRKVEGLDSLSLLLAVLESCGQDRLIPPIAWPNLHPLLEEEGRRFVERLETLDLRASPALAAVLPRVLERLLAARQPDLEAVRRVAERLAAAGGSLARDGLSVLARAAAEAPASLKERLREELAPLLERLLRGGGSGSLAARLLCARLGVPLGSGSADPGEVRAAFRSDREPEASRIEALEALVAFRDPALLDLSGEALASARPAFAARVLAALGAVEDPRLAETILGRFPGLDPQVQPLAVDLLLQREVWARKLLDSVLAGKLPRSTLHANHLRQIMEANDREAIWAVEKVWGTVRAERSPERERVVTEMGDFLRSSPGDPGEGARVFRNLCAQCHLIYGQGTNVGPDLTTNGRASFEQLVSSVFDPSLVVGPGYGTVLVVTRDGRNLTGVVVEEGPDRVVLRMQGGAEEAVPRARIQRLLATKLSMMPEGIETLVSRKDLADLFAYLALDRPPSDPAARPIPGAPVPARGARAQSTSRDQE